MKILVIGGMHGNEPLGLEIVKLFRTKPVKDVEVIVANEQAVAKNCRFVKTDLNRSFPGNIKSSDYETKRAAELLKLAKKFDVVLDLHNTHCPNNDCGFVGDSAGQQLYDVAAWLRLNRVIGADYECINKYALNCLSIEISLDSRLMNAEKWYARISKLAQQRSLPRGLNIEKYRFVYRMTLEDKKKLQLEKRNLQAFKPIDQHLAKAMSTKSPAYPIFIGDSYTPYNYGGLLNKIDV